MAVNWSRALAPGTVANVESALTGGNGIAKHAINANTESQFHAKSANLSASASGWREMVTSRDP